MALAVMTLGKRSPASLVKSCELLPEG